MVNDTNEAPPNKAFPAPATPNGRRENQPPDPKGAAQATEDNNLTTGHSNPGDGGDDNAIPQSQR